MHRLVSLGRWSYVYTSYFACIDYNLLCHNFVVSWLLTVLQSGQAKTCSIFRITLHSHQPCHRKSNRDIFYILGEVFSNLASCRKDQPCNFTIHKHTEARAILMEVRLLSVIDPRISRGPEKPCLWLRFHAVEFQKAGREYVLYEILKVAPLLCDPFFFPSSL